MFPNLLGSFEPSQPPPRDVGPEPHPAKTKLLGVSPYTHKHTNLCAEYTENTMFRFVGQNIERIPTFFIDFGNPEESSGCVSGYPVVVIDWVQYSRASGTLLLPRILGAFSRFSGGLSRQREREEGGPYRGSSRTLEGILPWGSLSLCQDRSSENLEVVPRIWEVDY